MAGTLSALLVAVVCCCTVWAPAHGQGTTCIYMDRCSEEFNDEARLIGHDRESYCELREKELRCFNSVLRRCPSEQQQFAQKQLQNAQNDQDTYCDATSTMSSFVVVSVAAAVALFYSCLL